MTASSSRGLVHSKTPNRCYIAGSFFHQCPPSQQIHEYVHIQTATHTPKHKVPIIGMSAEIPQDDHVDEESPQWLQWSRNGRRMACLPCRRRKLACDHNLPTCYRCQKAKKAVNCVYELAPELSVKRQKRAAPSPSNFVDSLETSLAPLTDSSPSIIDPRGVKPVEFLGPTSIPTFIQELDGQLLPSAETVEGQVNLLRAAADSPSILEMGFARNLAIGMAVEVLQCIPDQQTCSALIRRCRDPADGWIRQIVHSLSNSLHDTFKPHDDKMRRSNLTQIAGTLTSNANTAIDEGRVSMEQWLASISGHNIRWECIGVLFCFWAAASMRSGGDDGEAGPSSCLPDSSQPLQRHTDPSQRYMQCVHHCIDLCGRTGPGSTLLVYLLLKAAYLTSIQHGDASKLLHLIAITLDISLKPRLI